MILHLLFLVFSGIIAVPQYYNNYNRYGEIPGEITENKYPIELNDFGNLHADAVRLAQDDDGEDLAAAAGAEEDKDADTEGDADADNDTDAGDGEEDLAGEAAAVDDGEGDEDADKDTDVGDGDGEEDLAGAAGVESDTEEGGEPSAPGKRWFKAINAQTLDSVITEMNEMNRWFAKVVKYWDDFTSGGDGSTVLEQNGKGIKKLQDKGDAGEGGAEGATEGPGADAEEEGAGDDAAAADAEGTDGADAEEGADGAAAADGEESRICRCSSSRICWCPPCRICWCSLCWVWIR